MARFRKGTEVSIEQYGVLMRELSKITKDKKIIAQKMAVAMRFAIKPTFQMFKRYVENIPRDTGNLASAAASKVKKYNRTGNVVALVGYFKSKRSKDKPDKKGRDRAYHQHLVEYGTKMRKTRSGASRGISPPGATPGIEPMSVAYKNTVGQVNSRIVQKTPGVLKSVYRQLEKIKSK